MPLILPGNVASALGGGYEVANSCRFNKGDTAYMHKTLSAGNRRTWTFSTWFKRISLGTQVTFGVVQTSTGGDNVMAMQITTANKIEVWDYAGGITASIITNRVFRDTSAWYHVVVAADTTSGTANNRLRLYINGTEERGVGGYATDTMPSLNLDFNINQNTKVLKFGAYDGGSVGSPADFYFAETVFIDGTQYAASDFGEFDEDTPTVFKPKDVSELTFGTNGFYLDYEDSSNLGNDANSGTDLTEVSLAATDQCQDSPTNNFATLNPLDNAQSSATYSEGNCKWVTTTNAKYLWGRSTIGMSAGMWYAEFKATSIPEHGYIGICVDAPDDDTTFLTNGGANDHVEYGYKTSDGNSYNNTGSSSYGDTYTDGDIIGVYLDLDNNKLYFAKNGTIQNSGTGISITAAASNGYGEYFFCCADGTSGTSGTFEANFGNPSYTGTDKDDKNGYGSFEYDPSVGTFDSASKDFLALCTKNLGSDGG